MTNTEIQIELGIVKIKDLGFFINETLDAGEDSQLVYNLNFVANIPEEWVEFTIEAQFKNITGEIFISGKVLTRFIVKDLKNFTSNDHINLPPDALTTMFSMSFTHTRAILAKNTTGSKFAEVYLPIINPVEVLNSLLNPTKQP